MSETLLLCQKPRLPTRKPISHPLSHQSLHRFGSPSLFFSLLCSPSAAAASSWLQPHRVENSSSAKFSFTYPTPTPPSPNHLPQLGLSPLEIIPSTVPEAFPKDLDPFEYVLQTATQKAMTVYTQELSPTSAQDPALVIAADTIVLSSLGQILEKPTSEANHISMLRSLRDGGMHKVFTAVAVMAPLESARDPGYALETTVEETTVRFDRRMSDEMLLAYVRTREGADKAGGYGIQGIGAVLVERIEGSWDNVVGLPLKATLGLIEKVLRADDSDETSAEEGE